MLRKTGLLIVSNPTQIGKLLSSAEKQVKNTLYIQLLSSLTEPYLSFHSKVFNTWPKFNRTIHNIYTQVAVHCKNLDVKVLLSGLKYNATQIRTENPIDIIIFDKLQKQTDIEAFVKARIQNVTEKFEIVFLEQDNDNEYVPESEEVDDAIVKHTVLGGTFDRLHVAHKLLLTAAVLRSTEKVTVGVTDQKMIQSKLLWELIEDSDIRKRNVNNFLVDICPELKYDVVSISDPFGPAVEDPTMEIIVVSPETVKGGEKINLIRKEKGMNELVIIPIDLVDEPNPTPIEESKISSSTQRIRLLGTLLRPVEPRNLPTKPYVIGLTGGIASGKSGVSKHLENLGALIINCDIIAHQVYEPGKPCHKALVDYFGNNILNENNTINRQALGAIVFKDPKELEKLNSIVWPFIAEEVQKIISTTDNEIVVIEAAVLLTAGWNSNCHEVWTTLVPRSEAVKRLTERNKLSEEQALQRIDSQPSNLFYVQNSHVVFCTLWEVNYTKQQVAKAWNLLKERIMCQ